MKATTPEKIYVHIKDKPCEITFSEVIEKGCSNIEYIRTDAFIKKVESFLNKKNDRDFYTIGYIRRHLKDIIKEVGL